jgi:hypothetical protein
MGNFSPDFLIQSPEKVDYDAGNRHQNPEEEEPKEIHISSYNELYLKYGWRLMAEEYEEETRRGKLQLIRDCLLALELEGRSMKPTLLMYAMRVSWKNMVGLIKMMAVRQLITLTRPVGYGRGKYSKVWDRRSNTRIGISLKGKYILRLLDEMLRYLDDETPPQINPPLWLMRKALETKGFNFMGELDNLQKQNLLALPSHLDDPTPFDSVIVEKPDESVIPSTPDLSPGQKKGVFFTLTPDHPIQVRELVACFVVKQPPVIGLYCSECGYSANSLRGLSIHVGHVHPDKKKEIMDGVARFYDAKVA